ncbi:MAG: hypothetical protein DMF64_21950 [Acidobacteria bacterium]|nr:MAG: hypothetical protein DMF64_21950 [Acidobacteriota bacterium]
MENNSEDWVTQREAAEQTGKSLAAINNLVRRGRIASKEIYGKTLVSLSEVQAYDVAPGRPPKNPADKTRTLNAAFKQAIESGRKTRKKKGGKR